MALKEGDKAPEFSAIDQEGNTHTLNDYSGSWILLYFYPKDDTPGCTKEACSIRDNFPKFKDLGITVLGVSTQGQDSHKKFAEKYGLPFTLLVDEDKTINEAYGVWQLKKFMGREYMGTMRWSFLIDPNGKIAKIYTKVKPAEHAEEVLEDLKDLQK